MKCLPSRAALDVVRLTACCVWLSILSALAGCAWQDHIPPAPSVVLVDVHSGGTRVTFSPHNRWLASAGRSGRIALYRMPEAAFVRAWQAHTDSVNGLAFLDASRLLSAGYDGRMYIWDINGERLRTYDGQAPIRDLAADPAGGDIITGHADGTIRRWRIDRSTPVAIHRSHGRAVRAVAYHPSSGRIASSSTDGTVVLRLADGSARTLQAPPSDAWSLHFNADGTRLWGGGWFDLFRWELERGGFEVVPSEHRGIIKTLRRQTANGPFASISRQTDSSILLLDPHDGSTLQRLGTHELCGADVYLSRDGRWVASTADDGAVWIWRLPLTANDAHKD